MRRISHQIMASSLVAAGLLAAEAAAGPSLDRGQPRQSQSPAERVSYEFVPVSTVANLLTLPLVPQSTSFSCGVAALQSVLFYYDRAQDYLESDLIDELGVTGDGVLYRKMKRFAEKHDYRVTMQRDISLAELKSYINRRQPVIVLLQAYADEEPQDWSQINDLGHYAVVIGYDERNIYFMDSSMTGNYSFIPTAEFLARWHLEDDEWTGDTEILQHFAMVIWRDAQPEFGPDRAYRMP